jgi:hypothetical protein
MDTGRNLFLNRYLLCMDFIHGLYQYIKHLFMQKSAEKIMQL